MINQFEKLTVMIAIVLFASSNARGNDLNSQRQHRINMIIAELRTCGQANRGLNQMLSLLSLPELSHQLGIDLTFEEYMEIRHVILELQNLEVFIEPVPVDEMFLSTQEYSE